MADNSLALVPQPRLRRVQAFRAGMVAAAVMTLPSLLTAQSAYHDISMEDVCHIFSSLTLIGFMLVMSLNGFAKDFAADTFETAGGWIQHRLEERRKNAYYKKYSKLPGFVTMEFSSTRVERPSHTRYDEFLLHHREEGSELIKTVTISFDSQKALKDARIIIPAGTVLKNLESYGAVQLLMRRVGPA